MNKRTLSGWAMSLRVQSYLKKKPTEVAAIVGASDALADLDAKIAAIDQLRVARETTSEGYTFDKQTHQTALVDLAQGYASVLISFAAVSKDEKLLKLTKKLRSELASCGAHSVQSKSEKLLSSMEENLAGLAPWKITAASLTDFQAKIDAFKALLELPGQIRKARKELGKNIEIQMKDLLAGFNTLDDIFASADPALVSEYKEMRAIDSPPRTKLSAIVSVFVKESGLPVEKAHLVAPFGTYKTSQKGNLRLKSVERGSYPVVIKMPGYQDTPTTLNIVEGVTTRLAVYLETV